jgi:arylsulfatase A-like enzyme
MIAPCCRLVLVLTVLAADLVAASGERPNIILILADDLGYGDVGAFYQNQRSARQDRRLPSFRTPSIDTLARDGMMLRQHYCGAPVCAPSRASLLAGRTQGHASVRDNQFDRALAERITLGSVLQQAGYATAAIGKWGLPGGGEAEKNPRRDRPAAEREAEFASWTTYPTRRGFDLFYGYVRHRDGHFHYPKEDGREIWENDREVSAGLDLCYTTDLFTARAKRWIVEQRAARPGQPFFLYLAYDTPHAVLANPPGAYPAGGGLRGGVQWTGRPGAMINTAAGRKDGWMHPDYAGATWDHDGDPATAEQPWPEVQKRHANSVRRIDDSVGDLLQLLADLQLADNTLVVFTSDNGPSQESYLPEAYTPDFFQGFGPFSGIKRDTLEGGIREPTLVRWPAAVPAGRSSDQPSGQWDWLATFAEVAGVVVPASTDGVSLLPVLTGRGLQPPSMLYVEYFNNQRTPGYPAFHSAHRNRPRGQMQAVFVDGFKGLRYGIKAADDPFEIYDLAKDPSESANLASDPALAGLQARMKARVLQVRRPDPAAARPYDQAPVPPVASPPTMTGSLSWACYEGEWPWLPDLRRLRSAATGTAASLAPVMLPAGKPAALGFSGLVLFPSDGVYTFSFAGHGEVMLFLHDIRVLDTTAEAQGTVRLSAGWHPLRLYYRTDGRDPALELIVRDEQGRAVPLSPDRLASLPLP